MPLRKIDPASVSALNGKKRIFTHHAGNEITVRTIGIKRPTNTKPDHRFSNHPKAVSTSEGLIKSHFPYFANQALILTLFPQYHKK